MYAKQHEPLLVHPSDAQGGTMHVLLVASHEYGRQHCPVAEQSAPKVLGSVQPGSPPETDDGVGDATGLGSVGSGEVSASV